MTSSTEKYLGRVADTIESRRIVVVESFEGQRDFALQCPDEEFLRHQKHFEDKNVLAVSKRGLLVKIDRLSSHEKYRLSACPQCWGAEKCATCDSEGRVYLSFSSACKRCSGMGLATSYSGLPDLCQCASLLGVKSRATHWREFSPFVADNWTSSPKHTYTEKK